MLDADAEAEEVFGAECTDDVFDAVVSGRSGAKRFADFSKRDIEIVVDDGDVARPYFVELRNVSHGVSGTVHKCRGASEKNFLGSDSSLGTFRSKRGVFPEGWKFPVVADKVETGESGIMSCANIFFAGIAETDDEVHRDNVRRS